MNFTGVNFLAVLVTAIVQMVLGFLWYGPLFSKPWMKMMGMKADDMSAGGPSPVIYLVPLIGSLVSAYVLALFINAANMATLGGGALIGLLAGVGFVGTAFGANYLFARRSLQLYLIDAGYPMIGLIIAGAILGAWH
jgi:hypothetical protein